MSPAATTAIDEACYFVDQGVRPDRKELSPREEALSEAVAFLRDKLLFFMWWSTHRKRWMHQLTKMQGEVPAVHAWHKDVVLNARARTSHILSPSENSDQSDNWRDQFGAALGGCIYELTQLKVAVTLGRRISVEHALDRMQPLSRQVTDAYRVLLRAFADELGVRR